MSMRTFRTMCPMNCHPTLCGMLVEIENEKIKDVKGDSLNPDSTGFLCIRGKSAAEIINNPNRLLYPLIRDNRRDKFRRASWDEALDRIVSGMQSPETTGIWAGHGVFSTNYGTRFYAQLLERFANIHGSTLWGPQIICWGLGAFGLALTGLLETHTKEDMGKHAELIILWATNLASQPNTAPHLAEAKKRGARIITIDVRKSEAAHASHEAFIIRPGTDTALALAMANIIVSENLYDSAFISRYTVGFSAFCEHIKQYTPEWAAAITGINASHIYRLSRQYAHTKPAMIVLGGSSMHKGNNSWQAGRAISCLPALTGNIGIPGSGLGPRHGAMPHGYAMGNISTTRRRGIPITPNQMPEITLALQDGRIETLLLMGSNMLSSFADSTAVAHGLDRVKLIVSFDLFLNDTAQRYADIVLPGTSWLEEVGCKATSTHLYLMEQALPPDGETRSLGTIIEELAQRLDLTDCYPWESHEAMIDAVIDHPGTDHTTIKHLRSQEGIQPLNISHVAYP